MFQFILTDLKNNYKLSIAYSLILILLTAIEYVFFELVNYPDVLYYGGAMFSFMTLAVVGLLFIMTFYLNTFYIEEKRSQIVFLSLSGSTLTKLGLFLLVEYFIMLCISMVIAVFLGKGLFIGVLQYAGSIVEMDTAITFSSDAMVEMIGIEIAKSVIMVMLNISFIYKNEISEIINKVDKKRNKSLSDSVKKSLSSTGAIMGAGMAMMRNDEITNASSNEEITQIMQKQVEMNKQLAGQLARNDTSEAPKKIQEKEPKKYKLYLPMIIYILGLVGMTFIKNPMICCIAILVIGLAIVSFLKTRVYAIFDILEQDRLYRNPMDYVVYQEILHRLNSNQMILIVMNIALPFFIFEATTRATLLVEILACFSFIVLLFVLMVLLLLKNFIDVGHGISNYQVLYVIGYNKKELIQIANKANFIYYTLSVGLSLFAIMVFAIKMLYSTWLLCLLICVVMIAGFFISVLAVMYYNKVKIRRIQ